MCDTMDQLTQDGSFGKEWKNRFLNKWPTVTTLMHQSEITIQPYVSEHKEPFEKMFRSAELQDWDGSSQDSWPATQSTDILEGDVSSTTLTSTPQVKKRRCNTVCRNILCVTLIMSIVGAVIVVIGLTAFRNHVPSSLTIEQQQYLNKIFCELLKRLLLATDFPVETGLQNCHTSLQFMSGSNGLHIEMHVFPRDGYTLREKILRALKDEVEAEEYLRDPGIEVQHSTSTNVDVNDTRHTPNQSTVSRTMSSENKQQYEDHITVGRTMSSENKQQYVGHATIGRTSTNAQYAGPSTVDSTMSSENKPHYVGHATIGRIYTNAQYAGPSTVDSTMSSENKPHYVVHATIGRTYTNAQYAGPSTVDSTMSSENKPHYVGHATIGRTYTNAQYAGPSTVDSTMSSEKNKQYAGHSTVTASPPLEHKLTTEDTVFGDTSTFVDNNYSISTNTTTTIPFTMPNSKSVFIADQAHSISITQRPKLTMLPHFQSAAKPTTLPPIIVPPNFSFLERKIPDVRDRVYYQLTTNMADSTMTTSQVTPSQLHNTDKYNLTGVTSQMYEHTIPTPQHDNKNTTPLGEFTPHWLKDTSNKNISDTKQLSEFTPDGLKDTLNHTVIPDTNISADVATHAYTATLPQLDIPSTTINPKQQLWDKVPIATKLFHPDPIKIGLSNVTDSTDTNNVNKNGVRSTTKNVPKIVESLMAGGVMKLPFKTNSNFRFLFSSDSEPRRGAKPDGSEKHNDKVITSIITHINEVKKDHQNVKASINRIEKVKEDDQQRIVSETSNIFTEKPTPSDLFRTLRVPTASTRSFIQ